MFSSRNTQNLTNMDLMVILTLCMVVIQKGASEPNQFYKTQIAGKPELNGDNANEKVGFVHPLDFKSFTGHFFGSSQAAESRHFPASEAAYGKNNRETETYPQLQHFASPFSHDGEKDTTYRVVKYLNPKATSLDQSPKPSRSEEHHEKYEESYLQPVPKRSFRQSPKHPTGKHYGKSSYPPIKGNRRASDPSPKEYYADLYSKQKDVEMILPMHKAIILPMVNGKPKPYQGYRAAPEVEQYESTDERDVIYGKPKKGVESISYRIKRSPAEYHGGIYPHFDYSDPENADRVSKDNREDGDKEIYKKRRNNYPKKHRSKTGEKPYNYYKYPKGNRKTSKRSSDESGDQSEEGEEQAEEEEEQKTPRYKYQYDSSFNIPELTIKYYPYEKYASGKQNDNKEEGTEDEETHESQIDEYTAGYERYKKTLPTDLESYFGKPDFGDYSVEATENLEQNKNCERVTTEEQKADNATESANSDKGKQVCYICTDPKTGGNYEQCAYKSEPKSEKYYYGGSTSFQSDDSPAPVNYRYRRSTFGDGFDLDKFVFGRDSEVKRTVRQNKEHSLFDRPRKEQKRRYKNWQSDSDEKERYPSYGSYRKQDPHGSSSSRRNRKAKSKEGPPDSYDGPKYTYEGPRQTYEGPSEPYEGPINKDYYISSDDRIENDDGSQSNDESQTQPQKEYYEYNTYHPPDRRYGQSSRRNRYSPEPKRDVEEVEEESFGPETSYAANYRFGPEHFVDDEVEEERPKEKQRSEKKPKPIEKRQKHSGSESRQAPSAEKEDKDAGSVKVFKNGDICRKKKVDGMICMVCKNEKTAATYEQCQYSSKPKDKYYAFGSQKSYRTSDPNAERGNKNEEEDQHPEKSDVIEKKILITKQSKVFQDNSGPLEALPSLGPNHGDLIGSPSDNLETHLYDSNNNNNDTDNRQVSESIMRIEPRDGIEGLEEYLYSDSEDNEKKASSDDDREYRSYDEYFHDIFPEFSTKKENEQYNEESKEPDDEDEAEESEESESERHVNFDPFSNIRKFKDNSPAFLEEYSVDEEDDSSGNAEATNEEPLRLKDKKSRVPADFFLEESEEYHKKDIEKALGEFQNRDWSNCKKIVKNKLTCYQCIDKNGVNNEECMYVEASQPLKQHLAYHEKKELKPETLDIRRETNVDKELTPTEVPVTEAPQAIKRTRNPKNSKDVSEEVAAPARDNLTKRRPIGDFQGVTTVPEEDVMTPVPSLTTEAVVEDTTEKPQLRSNKRHQKRIKTSIKTVNGTTERLRKRKYPLKKFAESGGVVAEVTESIVTVRPTEEITETYRNTRLHGSDIK